MRATPYILLAAGIVVFGYLIRPRIGGGDGPRPMADINGGIKSALVNYLVDTGAYPSNLEALIVAPAGVGKWHGPYLVSLPIDPWGNHYVYHYPGRHNQGSYDLLSVGPDGKEGTKDDVVNYTN